MEVLVIKTGNFILMSAGLLGFFKAMMWVKNDHISGKTASITLAFCLLFMAQTINAGWFFLSRHTAPGGAVWNPLMLEWRWLLIATTAAMYLAGLVYFQFLIDEPHPLTSILTALSIIGVSAVVGFLL